METKLYFDAIYGNKRMNAFMDACDLSDRGHKEYSTPKRITLITESEITEDLVQKTTKILVDSLTNQGCNVTFVGFRSLSIHSVYIKEGIQSISNGSNWGLFKDMLNHLGYTCEVTQYMCVTTAKFNQQPNFHI